jgi:hypothetical protein
MKALKHVQLIVTKRIEEMEDKLRRAPYFRSNRNFWFFMDTLNHNRELNIKITKKLLKLRS